MSRFWEELLHGMTGHASRHSKLPDLRHLPSHSVAVMGTQYLVNDAERRHRRHRLYVLRVTRTGSNGTRSIAVYANGRLLGVLPTPESNRLIPPLSLLGGAAITNGTGTRANGIRLWVDVPTNEDLATFAADWLQQKTVPPQTRST